MSLLVEISSNRTKSSSVLVFFLFLLAGCANPGPPHPPSLHLPEVVSDLSAERVGAEVKLHWTTPAKSTDGLKMTGTMTAQVCRALSITGGSASTCSTVRSVPVKAGASEAVDLLPLELHTDPQALLEYRVVLQNSQQRSAGPSTPAFAAAGAAPRVVSGLRVEATAQGALLQWEAKDAADRIELDRLHPVAAAVPSRSTGQNLQPPDKEPAEMHFRAAKIDTGSSPFRADAGGSLDTTAHGGESYTYTAQRVRNVVLEGHPLEIRSDLSPAVTIAMHDSFPPSPPTGLEAISAGQVSASPAIDLSWKPNTEGDFAGYLVYRQELGPDGATLGPRLRLTPSPLREPGFHDGAVVAGHTYSYSVAAMDTSGNESAAGVSAKEEVRLP